MVDQDKTLEGIKKAARAFNQGLVKALHDILNLDFAVELGAFFIHSNEFKTSNSTIVCLPFTGVINGEFFLCVNSPQYLTAMSAVNGRPANHPETWELLSSTFQELVNIAAGEAMLPIKETFGSQTMLAPRLIEGKLHYPRTQIFSSVLKSSDGSLSIEAKIALDLMEQDINIQQQKLQEKSIVDDTGLYNKKHFFTILKEMEEKAKTGTFFYTVVFTDINRLKYVNDNLGHDAGDEFIKKACGFLKNAQGKEDFSFRIGGDELVMILPGQTLQQAAATLKKLEKQMLGAVIKGVNVATKKPETVAVHLSIGAASNSEGFDAADKVLKQADLRMEHAKRQWYIEQGLDRRK